MCRTYLAQVAGCTGHRPTPRLRAMDRFQARWIDAMADKHNGSFSSQIGEVLTKVPRRELEALIAEKVDSGSIAQKEVLLVAERWCGDESLIDAAVM